METQVLKRFQILLPEWQEEYLRYISKKQNYSFSETVRIVLAEGILYMIPLLSPEYKTGTSKTKLAKILKEVAKLDSTKKQRNKFRSIIYFEARKAIDYRLSKTNQKRRK